jgi:NADPH:quinone reductase-like Zn-dependent oxidoreductase
MKAIVQTRYGTPGVLELKEIDKPVVKDDDVLIRVHAAALHAGDYFIMKGVPYLARLVVGLPKPRTNYVVGLDVAGHVEAVGKNVTRFRPGDEVFAACSPRSSGTGACAEYASSGEDSVVLKPANLTFEQAAAIPVSALAALHGLRDAGKVQPGQRVLINAGMGYIVKAFLRSAFVRQQGRPFISTPNHEDLVFLKELTESGKVTPVIDRTYPLSETPQALGYIGEGHARGKVVITVQSSGDRGCSQRPG